MRQCLLHWRETGNRKAWAGIGAPDVTLCWDREVGVLRSVKLDVHRRIKGLHVSDLWPVLRSRLADAGVIEDPATRAETLGVDVKNRVLQRGRDVDETKKLSAESKVLGDDDGEHVGVSHAQQAAAEALPRRLASRPEPLRWPRRPRPPRCAWCQARGRAAQTSWRPRALLPPADSVRLAPEPSALPRQLGAPPR